MKAGLKYAGYGFYAVLVTVVLLYYHFPSEAFKSHLVQMAGRMDPGIIFSTRALDPSFPPGLRLQGPALSLTERPETAFFRHKPCPSTPALAPLFWETSPGFLMLRPMAVPSTAIFSLEKRVKSTGFPSPLKRSASMNTHFYPISGLAILREASMQTLPMKADRTGF